MVTRHKEERADLLAPSGSNDDLSFPSPATWSEADLSSSSATLTESPPTAQRLLLEGTPAVMAGLLLGAVFTACLHHVYLSILRGRTVSGQFWIKNSSNALSTLVQWLCTASVSASLTQLIWWLIRRRPFTVLQLNHLFGLPNPFRILCLASSKRLRNVIPAITMATLLQAFALVSILAPNSLEVGSALPQNIPISVPTVFFSKTNLSGTQGDFYPSAAWQKFLGQALQSDALIGWNAPAGCGAACNYTIQYPAPALRCTELGTGEVSTMVSSPTNGYPTTVYNTSYSSVDFIAVMSMAWRTYNANGKSTIAGARCSVYNTTQQSIVSFVNNTGMISPSIVSYNSLTNFSSDMVPQACGTLGSSNSCKTLSLSLFSYAGIQAWLYDQIQGHINYSPDSAVQATWEPSSLMFGNNLFSLNETARTFTPNSENVVNALEQILVNVTVALITSMGHTTMVNASVAQDQLVWVYNGQRLWIIYGTALVSTVACGVVGLACILKDGEDSDLTFWDIVRTTRSSELDAVIEGEKSGHVGKDTMLQYAVQGKKSDADTSGVFVLARSPHKRSRS